MRIEHFRRAFVETGEALRGAGFAFAANAWRLETGDAVLSYEATADKFGRAFQVRSLTVCLAHKGVMGTTGQRIWEFEALDCVAPVQISPCRLPSYRSALDKDRAWHYVHPSKDAAPDWMCYRPLYYGGATMQPDELVQRTHALRVHGLDITDDDDCVAALQSAAQAVADAAASWACAMSHAEVCRQLRVHGGEWWFAREWLDRYRAG